MEVTAQIVSLLDPLSGDRIVIPVKGPNCAHPNIWDKEVEFLSLSVRKLTKNRIGPSMVHLLVGNAFFAKRKRKWMHVTQI